jgi:Tol biopolymer transport system component
MPELREVFEMVTKQTEPDTDSWHDQERRQRTRARNRKIGAIGVAAAIAILAVTFAIRVARDEGRQPAIVPSPTPTQVEVIAPEVDSTFNIKTGELTPMPRSIAREADWYALSPDGSTISYVAPSDDGNPQIFVANLDGTEIRRVTNERGGVSAGSWSAWSPDGSMIAYEGVGEAGVANLFVVDVSTGATTQVTFSTVADVFGTQFSPDGSALLYAGGDRGQGVRLAPIDGGKHTLLAGGGRERGDAGNGTFSPDGSMLSYAFNETVGAFPSGVWIAQPDGTDARQLIDVFLECRPGSWSPDARLLACWELNGAAVFLIDVETETSVMIAEAASAIWLDETTLLLDV